MNILFYACPLISGINYGIITTESEENFMLKRKMYDRLLDWKKTKSKECLLIKGARQVGKTYLVLS